MINNTFSNNTDHDTYSGNILANTSDHFSQFIVINKVNIDYKRWSYSKRDFSNFNENNFVSDFSKIADSFLKVPNINLNCKFEMFYDNLSSCVNHHVPTKKMTKKDLKFHTKPWITSKNKNLIKYRDKLMRKLNKKYTLDNEYLSKKFRNHVVSEFRTSRINYYNKYFTEDKKNMKMLWTGIRSIINVKNARLNNISQIIQAGKTINDPGEMAKSFNHYFVNVASNLDNEIPRTKKISP